MKQKYVKMLAALIPWGWLLFPAVASADEPRSLEELRLQHETRMELVRKPLNDLVAKYRSALRKLEKKYSDSGNLQAVLSVRNELEAVEKGEAGGDSGGNELQRMRNIYKQQRSRRESEMERGVARLNAELLQQLRRLEIQLTKKREIDAALDVKREIEKVQKIIATRGSAGKGDSEDVSGYEWSDPEGGQIVKERGIVELTGSGKAGSQAVSILNLKLPDSCEISGRCLLKGSWAGFVFAADRSGEEFHTIFCREDGAASRVEFIQSRQRLPKPEVDVPWPKDKWVSFSVKREKGRWELRIGGKSTVVETVDGKPGDYFGLLVFSPASSAVKDLKITR